MSSLYLGSSNDSQRTIDPELLSAVNAAVDAEHTEVNHVEEFFDLQAASSPEISYMPME